ncbi:MAG: hypothetical protein JST50_00210 [Bacteroidetes bacterium]|jgi:hypothetical protein|nr:hypothetical protein [Bacteroidota bacterium]
MAEQGRNKVDQLRQRYIQYQLLADAFFAAALAALIWSFGYTIYNLSWIWGMLAFLVIYGFSLLLSRWWKIGVKPITAFLNLKYPDLEESSELVLKESSDLTLLEKMQLVRIEDILDAVPLSQKQFAYRLRLGILFFLVMPIFCWEITWLRNDWRIERLRQATPLTGAKKNNIAEKILPQVSAVSIKISPPAYTHKASREQDKFTIEAEEGSTINWKLSLNVQAKRVELIFNNGEKMLLKNTTESDYEAQRSISKSGFYQVNIDGKLSDLYQLQAIRDNPPVIHIKSPQQYTYIDAGEAPRVAINVALDDDYGISNAFIYTTVAKGSGEAVKFKEQKIDFGTSFSTQNPHYDLQKTINLPSLNMEPGDELYFYVQAQDNHNQQTRSDVYIVSLQDTAQLLSMDGLLSGVNVKPEFFRSERQIILDSEKLLRDRDSISKEAFNTRSNELGNDQKLLRLRYGKFLGEEAESDINPKEEQEDAVSDPKNFGNAAVVLDKYSDKHDNAEDAQFFDPAIKAQLKATLTEMWKAELQLRLYKPEVALPFEYKALRLLKDLQQKSRVYVAKTAYNPAPLKMEKRLTGDLSKIIQPVDHQTIKPGDDEYGALKNAIGVLELLRYEKINSNADIHTLQLANQQLSERASAQPELYLPAVSALRKIISSGKANRNEISVVEKAIQRLLPAGKLLPSAPQNAADMGLSSGYYKNLGNK